MTRVIRAALLIALAIAPPAIPCSYLAGHYPGWLEQSTAERLLEAEAIVVGIGTSEGSVAVDRVVSGPRELLGQKLAPVDWIIACPGQNEPQVKAGEHRLVSVWGKPGRWWLERIQYPFAREGLLDGAATPRKIELVQEVVALPRGPGLLAAMQARAKGVAPDLAPLWASLIDEQARSISSSRPFAELKAIYDRAPRGEDPTRVRALDAMCMGDHREAVALERAVLAAGDDFDLIPAAIRCARRFRDHGALAQMVALAPVIDANEDLRDQALHALEPDWRASWEAHRPYYDMLTHDLESGRSEAWMSVLETFLCLATDADSDLGVALLGVNDGYARWLATGYFSFHPSPAALAIVRAKTAGRFGDQHRGLTVALAALGDADVVAWALGPHATQEDGWIASQVFEESPLPAARVTGVAQAQHHAGYCTPP
jgi:hypothetical protein